MKKKDQREIVKKSKQGSNMIRFVFCKNALTDKKWTVEKLILVAESLLNTHSIG